MTRDTFFPVPLPGRRFGRSTRNCRQRVIRVTGAAVSCDWRALFAALPCTAMSNATGTVTATAASTTAVWATAAAAARATGVNVRRVYRLAAAGRVRTARDVEGRLVVDVAGLRAFAPGSGAGAAPAAGPTAPGPNRDDALDGLLPIFVKLLTRVAALEHRLQAVEAVVAVTRPVTGANDKAMSPVTKEKPHAQVPPR